MHYEHLKYSQLLNTRMNIIILGCNGNIGKFISGHLANNINNQVYGIDLHNEFLGENERINGKIRKDNLYSSSLGPLSQPPNTKRDIT